VYETNCLIVFLSRRFIFCLFVLDLDKYFFSRQTYFILEVVLEETSCIRVGTVFCAMNRLHRLDGRGKMCVRNKDGKFIEGSSELY
jgi:hypothetical protein